MQLSLFFTNQEPRNPEPKNPEPFNREPQNPKPQNPERRTPNAEPGLLFSRHPRARRYVLRVDRDGAVHVTIPRWGSRRGAQAFAASQRAWVERQLRKVAAEAARPKPPELPREELQAWVARAKQHLPARLIELAAAHSLAVSRVSIRNQRWRWGSCNRSGHICLNWRLVTMPDWVRDYVLIHELMHLKRMDHSPKFWKLVAAACPHYQEARRWLANYQKSQASSQPQASSLS
jgi:predicted metal-dependent hydrolase